MGNLCHVLYYDGFRYRFEELICNSRYSSTDPADFNLGPENEIILVLVKGTFLRRYLNGQEII